MSEDKKVFVDEETYKRIIDELGYKPSNLFLNKFVLKNQVYVVSEENTNTPFFKNYRPNFYFKN